MFREHVLIALTILITILVLSFVILLTVYVQWRQLDGKKSSKIDEPEITVVWKAPVNESLLNQVEEFLANASDKLDNEMAMSEGNLKLAKRLAKIPDRVKVTTTTTTTTTENPDAEGFYTDDDFFLQFPPPPKNTRTIPYKLYRRNGHVTLQVPQSINLSNDMEHMKKVLEELNELHKIQRDRDDEQKQYALNGLKPWYPPTKEKQEGTIWIRNGRTTTTTTTMPKSRTRKAPFDDSAIFSIVHNNRMRRLGLDPFNFLGKRKKRSPRNRKRRTERRAFHRITRQLRKNLT